MRATGPPGSLLLGIVPVLLLVHMTLSIGPADRFAAQHLRFLVGERVFFFDELPVGYAVAVRWGSPWLPAWGWVTDRRLGWPRERLRQHNRRVGPVEILAPDPGWGSEFQHIARGLRSELGDRATRIDHVGSTSVAGLPAKDIIDVQISVKNAQMLREVAARLRGSGWTLRSDIGSDHRVPGLPESAGEWRKAFLREPPGSRRVNVHVRIGRRANQRYALLFRDYLRAHPATAAAYGKLKARLAAIAPDPDTFADAKDPACDLIYLAAEEWAAASGWESGPSDA